MTMDVSRYACARDSLAIALTSCAAIAVVAAITAAMLAIPLPHAAPAQYAPGMKGSVSLEHIGSSDSTWSFKLVNQWDHTVYFRGYDGSRPNVAVPFASTECLSITSTEVTVGISPGLIDPPPEEQFFEVHPGAQRFLAIYTPLVGECHLTLTLTDGTDVESNTWIERGNGR